MRRPVVAIFVSVVVSVALGLGCVYLAVDAVSLYGLALFLAAPFVLGFVCVALMRLAGPQSLERCIGIPLLTGLLLCMSLLLFGLEGIVCVLTAIPITLPPLAAGGLLAYWLLHRRDFVDPLRSAGASVLLLLACIVAEPLVHRELMPRVVTDSVVVRASPEETWNAVVGLDEVPTGDDWMFRAGVACPERTRIITPAAGGYRVCRLSTGNLIEQIEVFEPGRTLRWRTKATPPPIRETNPFHPHVDPPHLRGSYDTPRGEFALESLGPRLTRLTRRTWYTQHLYPQTYWNLLAEMAISRIHRTVLEHVRITSEGRPRGVRV